MPQILTIDEGQIELLDPPLELLRRMRSTMPLGLLRFKNAPQNAQAGIVMKCGEEEVYGVKFQPPDCEEETARRVFQTNRILVLTALLRFVSAGYAGTLIPVTYLKPKETGGYESGVACFAFPASRDKSRPDFGTHSKFEDYLMPGAYMYVLDFAKMLAEATRGFGVSPPRLIGMDTRPRLQLGMIMFDFLVFAGELLCLKCDVNANDPLWKVFHGLGNRRVWHLPSVPVEITPDQLLRAQGKLPVN